MNLLQEILNQSQDINPTTVEIPGDKPGEKQTVVGTMSDNAKQLWGLMVQVSDIMDPLIEEIQDLDKDSDRYKELNNKLWEIRLRAELLKEVFWATLKFEFPELLGKCSIGLAENNQVYWEACDHNHGINMDIMMIGGSGPTPPILADLFGRN